MGEEPTGVMVAIVPEEEWSLGTLYDTQNLKVGCQLGQFLAVYLAVYTPMRSN
jgi:hypothetical protein